MDARALKDRATELLAKGKFARAAEAYQQYCEADAKDLQSRLRLGDAWLKAGEKAKAIVAYLWAAEGFAKEGFLPRAIAASKLVLELDPSHGGVQNRLAQLYARKSSTASRVSSTVRLVDAAAPAGSADDEVVLEVSYAVGGPGMAAGYGPPAQVATSGSSVEPQPAPQPDLVGRGQEPNAPSSPEPIIEIEVVTDDAEPTPPLGPELEAVAGPAPPDPETPPAETTTPTFTELELDEADSLLHLVEAMASRAAPEAQEVEEAEPVMELEEVVLEPQALPKIPLFSDLPDEAFIALLDGCPLRRLVEGQRVIEQGSPGEAFFVVCAGRVRVFRTEAGERRDLATLEEGAFFGEMALLSHAPRSASVEALGADTQVLEVSAALLKTLSARYPSVARALRKFCRQRLLSNLMATSSLFRPFSRSDRRELIEKFRAREVGRGEVIITEGAQSDGLYVVLSGGVQVSRAGAAVAALGEGELFGEMSLLTRSPAAATVTATRHTSLLRLPREDFEVLILSHPQILELVSNLTDARQRANERIDLV